jgi:hypothetical protein
MPKIIRLTGAALNSEGLPLYIDIAHIRLIGTIEQLTRDKPPRLVTEVWVDRSVKYVREHITYVLRYWQHATDYDLRTDPTALGAVTDFVLIEAPRTTEWLNLARITYQPAVPAIAPKKKRRLFRS